MPRVVTCMRSRSQVEAQMCCSRNSLASTSAAFHHDSPGKLCIWPDSDLAPSTCMQKCQISKTMEVVLSTFDQAIPMPGSTEPRPRPAIIDKTILLLLMRDCVRSFGSACGNILPSLYHQLPPQTLPTDACASQVFTVFWTTYRRNPETLSHPFFDAAEQSNQLLDGPTFPTLVEVGLQRYSPSKEPFDSPEALSDAWAVA
jgi:hypothetical protein